MPSGDRFGLFNGFCWACGTSWNEFGTNHPIAASAASVAGLIKSKDRIEAGSKVVCVLTGNGLKDPDNAIKYSNADVIKTSVDINEILRVMNI